MSNFFKRITYFLILFPNHMIAQSSAKDRGFQCVVGVELDPDWQTYEDVLSLFARYIPSWRIEADEFDDCHKAQAIVLEDNEIQWFDDNVWSDFHNLDTVIIRRSHLKLAPDIYYIEENLKHLDTSN